MTTDMTEYNSLVAEVTTFDNDFEAKRQKRTRIILMVLICLAIPFLYLRLFNTEFELIHENEISLKYSTAWVVRFPAEFEEQKINTIFNDSSHDMGDTAPRTLYAYIEEGIEDVYGFDDSSLIAVRFPSTLKHIHSYAFENSKNLTFLFFPEKVTNLRIGEEAFRDTSIMNLDLPEGTVEIGAMAFLRCNNLRSVKLPEGIREHSYGIFSQCTNLQYIHFPNDWEFINDHTLAYCKNLERVDWPSSLQSIALEALAESSFWKKDIAELNLPESVYFAYTGSQTLFDLNRANSILAEKSSIPLEIIEEATTSEKIWIEGNWYSLPMSYEDFLATDDAWEFIEKGDDEHITITDYITITLKHGKSGGIVNLLLTNETVCGVEISDSYDDKPCAVVFPGGLIYSYNKWYRADRLAIAWENYSFGDDEDRYGTFLSNEKFLIHAEISDTSDKKACSLKYILFLVK